MPPGDLPEWLKGKLNIEESLREIKHLARTFPSLRERTKFLNDRTAVVSKLRDQLLGEGCEAESDWEPVRVETIHFLSRHLASQEISDLLLRQLTEALAKSDRKGGPILRQFMHDTNPPIPKSAGQ